jgi:hypothetical protein
MHQDVVKVDFTESRVQSYKTSLVALVRGKTIQTPVNLESEFKGLTDVTHPYDFTSSILDFLS